MSQIPSANLHNKAFWISDSYTNLSWETYQLIQEYVKARRVVNTSGSYPRVAEALAEAQATAGIS